MQKGPTLIKAGIIGLTVFIAYKVYQKAVAIKNLTFKIQKVAWSNANNGFIVTFFIGISNSTEKQILLNSIDTEIILNETLLGNVNQDINIYIPEMGQSVIPISINLFFGPIVETIVSIIKGTFQKTATFQLKGNARIEDITLPINIKYSFA